MLHSLRSFSQRHGYLAGILCILLLICGTTLQATHSHLHHENHADCSLCVTAHAVAEIVILPPTGFIAPVLRAERPVLRAARREHVAIWSHPLWNRPPPASSSIA